MTPFLQFAFEITVILLSAKIAGYISHRLGQPSVLGELLVGLLLGPTLLNLTHLSFITDAHLGEFLAHLGEMGVLLLMFLAGLELHLSDLTKNTRVSALSGILGVIVPVGLGWVVGLIWKLSPDHALFLGLTLGATSVSISAQTLMELKALRSRVGLGLLGAAVFDDILVILLLSTFLAIQSGGNGAVEIALVMGKIIVFLGLSVAFGIWVLPRMVRRVSKLPISQGALTLAVVIMLVYGIAAELIGGMAAITGTFVAGLMFARTPEKSMIDSGLRSLGYGFFVPIFFISIGLNANLRGITWNSLGLIFVVILVAVVGKMLGAGGGAKIAGFTWRESLQLGVGMISRGEVGLIVASVGLKNGLLTEEIFTAVLAMVLISTMVTPPLLRAVFEKTSGKPAVS